MVIQLIITTSLVLAVGMSVVWLLSLRFHNYAFVDVAWSYSFTVVAALAMGLSNQPSPAMWVLAGMFALHGLRLGTYLFRRTVGHPEEGRYVTLRQTWKKWQKFKFWLFFQMQGLSVLLLVTPLWVTAWKPREIGWTTLVGVILFIVGWVGESISDYQLHAFKKQNHKQGAVCNQGLWRYSRHPNYFFECLIWVSFAIVSAHWAGWISPLIIIYLITSVTGIPPTEQQNILSKGEAYRDYQRTTSALIPLPPRTKPRTKSTST